MVDCGDRMGLVVLFCFYVEVGVMFGCVFSDVFGKFLKSGDVDIIGFVGYFCSFFLSVFMCGGLFGC